MPVKSICGYTPPNLYKSKGTTMVYPDFSNGVKEVDLGPEASFTKFPTEVEVEGFDFYLAKGKDGVLRLLSSLCPHSWGTVYLEDTCFMCPSHGWRFEYYTGNCINGPIAQMYTFEVSARNGHLYASVPEKK